MNSWSPDGLLGRGRHILSPALVVLVMAIAPVTPAVAASAKTAQQIDAVTTSYTGESGSRQSWRSVEEALAEVEQAGRDGRRMIMASCPYLTDGAPATQLVVDHLTDAVFMSIFQYANPAWWARTNRFLSSIQRLPGVRRNAALRGPLGLWVADRRRLFASMDAYDAPRLCAELSAWRAAGWTEAAQPASPSRLYKDLTANLLLWRPVRRELLRIGVDQDVVHVIESAGDIDDGAILPDDHPLKLKLEALGERVRQLEPGAL
jgi:hypothetical protein